MNRVLKKKDRKNCQNDLSCGDLWTLDLRYEAADILT